MKDMLNLGLRLMAIALIAGLLLGATNLLTAERIALQKERRANEARMAVMPGNDTFEIVLQEDVDFGIRAVYSCRDGYVYTVCERGYGSSGVTATIGIDQTGVITAVRFDASSETPGLGAKAANEAYYGQYSGTNQAALASVQAISGATMTSDAAKKAVAEALAHFDQYYR